MTKGIEMIVSLYFRDTSQGSRAATASCPAAHLTQKFPILRISLFLVDGMEKVTIASLRAQLEERGETPPTRWTKVELQHRLQELQKEKGETVVVSKKGKTPLQSQITAINTASRLKSKITQLLQEEMMQEVTPNMTIEQMKMKAMQFAYEHTAVSGDDYVGFGRHSSMTYRTLKDEYPQYAAWVRATAKEEKETCVQLRRLATWLEQEMAQPIEEKVTKWTLVEPPEESPRPQPKAKSALGSRGRSSASSGASSVSDSVLRELVTTLHDLKDEVAQLKSGQAEERPRKKERE